MDLNRNVSLGIYDKNNVNKYNLPDGISFDASAGTQEKAVTAKYYQEVLRSQFTVYHLTSEVVRMKVLQRVIRILIL